MAHGGARPGAGRPSGSQLHRINLEMRQAILKASKIAGGPEGIIGYLVQQAKDNPGPFLALMGKCTQVNQDLSEIKGETGSLRVNFYIDYLQNGINGYPPTGPTISAEILPPPRDDTESSGD